jgi:hypothetical protein
VDPKAHNGVRNCAASNAATATERPPRSASPTLPSWTSRESAGRPCADCRNGRRKRSCAAWAARTPARRPTQEQARLGGDASFHGMSSTLAGGRRECNSHVGRALPALARSVLVGVLWAPRNVDVAQRRVLRSLAGGEYRTAEDDETVCV